MPMGCPSPTTTAGGPVVCLYPAKACTITLHLQKRRRFTIEELEVLIKRQNSNVTTRRTSTKPRKNSSTRTIAFRPQLQFWHGEQKQKAKEELSAVPECLINFNFSSAMGTERNKTKVVSSTSKDIGDLHMSFPINQVYCRVEMGRRYGLALRHGSSPISTLISWMRAGEGLIACESLEDV